VARGDVRRRDRGRVHRAVTAAGDATGLEICVYLARPGEGSPRDQAERTFAALGLAERPAVLVLVAPRARRVEVVTAPAARDRLPDEACARAVDAMTDAFARRRLGAGIEAGMRAIVEQVGGAG
jgi:uncharacterized membrane protein YgcG